MIFNFVGNVNTLEKFFILLCGRAPFSEVIIMAKFKYALIGHPLGHSMSPFIHGRLFELSGIDAEYSLMPIDPENFEQSFGELALLDGFNVTIPYKQDIIKMCSRTEGSASLYSSVNTVKCGGAAVGYNTDAIGFLKTFEHCGVKLCGRVALFGAGGVARMIAYECVRAGCRLTVAVRPSDIPAAEALVGEIKLKLPGAETDVCLLSELCGEYDIYINATPLGMYPNTDACAVDEAAVERCGAVFDVVYNPAETKLLRTAKRLGKRVLPGMPMLVWQAAAAHEIWYGAHFDKGDIDRLTEDTSRELEKRFRR